MTERTTAERILEAAVQLISEKGYAAATTRSIATLAGVNEVTIFRHFGNKRGILKAIVDKFSYGPVFQDVLQFEVSYNLKTDLLHFSERYFQTMLPIKELVLIAFKEAGVFPEIDEELARVPRQLKEQLMSYFETMKIQDKMADIPVEEAALSFIALNFGHFISLVRLGKGVSTLERQHILQTSMTIFSRGLTP